MKKSKQEKRLRRKAHIRKNVKGTSTKPRVYVYKSNTYIYSGFADDANGKVYGGGRNSANVKGATALGKEVAEKLKKAKIKEAVFDRSGYKYHGVVASLAEGIRKNGIKI